MSIISPSHKYYTGIGSRETPQHVLELMSKIAYKLARLGWHGRSGSAGGADLAFEQGFMQAVQDGVNKGGFTGYLPWGGFNGMNNDQYHSVRGNCKSAASIAEKVHPAWDRCSRGARALHTRNVYQVLGNDLSTPSNLCLFYAQPIGKSGQVKGGTNTAVKICIEKRTRCDNLYDIITYNKYLEWANAVDNNSK